jgi:hypothetical protein
LTRNSELPGDLLVFAGVLCEAAYAVIGKKLTHVMGPKRMASLSNLWGFVLMGPLGLYLALKFDFGAVQATTWGLLLFYALAASVWMASWVKHSAACGHRVDPARGLAGHPARTHHHQTKRFALITIPSASAYSQSPGRTDTSWTCTATSRCPALRLTVGMG